MSYRAGSRRAAGGQPEDKLGKLRDELREGLPKLQRGKQRGEQREVLPENPAEELREELPEGLREKLQVDGNVKEALLQQLYRLLLLATQLFDRYSRSIRRARFRCC
jgi:hypothetical protein